MSTNEPPPRSFYEEWKASDRRSVFDLLHGYIYLRWPYFYIASAMGRSPFSRSMKAVYSAITWLFARQRTRGASGGESAALANSYHGKVVPLDSARKLVTLNQPLTIRNLEKVIPYPVAKDIILNHPDHIVVLQCPCRTAREKPCLPLDVCLIVGEPFAGFVLKHHPKRSRRIDAAEAVAIIEAEDQRGHVHHAFFKDAMLGRFYAICNCCRCCCGAMQAHRNGIPMLASSGFVAEVDQALCVACGTCGKYCQFEAVQYIGGRKVIDEPRCLGCGVCVTKCAHGAIRLRRDEKRGTPLEIDRLAAAVQRP